VAWGQTQKEAGAAQAEQGRHAGLVSGEASEARGLQASCGTGGLGGHLLGAAEVQCFDRGAACSRVVHEPCGTSGKCFVGAGGSLLPATAFGT